MSKWWNKCNTLSYIIAGSGCCLSSKKLVDLSKMTSSKNQFFLNRVNNPKDANLMIIQGIVNPLMLHTLIQIYEDMHSPKMVIAFGNCPLGEMIPSYNAIRDIEKFIPIDFFVAGCPPGEGDYEKLLDHLREE